MHVVECLTHSTLGGGQAVVLTLVRQLQQRHPQLRFTIMLPEGGLYVGRFKALGVNVEEFGFDSISPFRVFQIAARLKALNPDVIHSHGKGAGIYTRLLTSRNNAALHVHSFHGFHPPDRRLNRRMYRSLETHLLSRTDTIVAISQSEADEIRYELKNAGSKLETIPNVLDCEELHSRAAQRLPPAVDDFLANNRGRFIVTMIGRDDPVKNYPLAFGAAELVLKENQDVCFVFVGAQNDVAGLADRFPRNILIVPWLENPAPLINQSNAIMLTSRKEGSPLVVQEAFCFGKPVVGTDVPGIRGNVQSGINGFLCAEEALSVANAVELLTKDSVQYKKLSENARTVASSLDIKRWAERYYDVYCEHHA